MMGNRGVKLVSNPVAHTRVSVGWCFPSAVTIPSASTLVIGDLMMSTLSSVRASRYPGPGVSLRQTGGKDGISSSMSSGFPARRCFIFCKKTSFAPICSGVPVMVAPWTDCNSNSTPITCFRGRPKKAVFVFLTFTEILVGLVVILEIFNLFWSEGDCKCHQHHWAFDSKQGDLQFSNPAPRLSISSRANVGESHV